MTDEPEDLRRLLERIDPAQFKVSADAMTAYLFWKFTNEDIAAPDLAPKKE